MKKPLVVIILFGLLLSLPGLSYQSAFAQTPAPTRTTTPATSNGTWSEAIDLCSTTSCWFPKMTSDSEGNVHVVWGSWDGSEAPTEQSINTIYYSRFDGTSWTTPLDIIIAPALDGSVEIGDILVSPDGIIYIAWGSDGTLYISTVPVEKATSAREWTTTTLDEGTRPRLAFDTTRNMIYCVYVAILPDENDTGDEEPRQLYNLMITYTDHPDQNWVERTSIWELRTKNAVLVISNVLIGKDGVIHTTWSENTPKSNWLGENIWYGRIVNEDNDISSTALKISGQADSKSPNQSYPYLAECSTGDLFIFWSNGVGSDVGRYYSFSYDAGKTWEPLENAFAGELSGLTGMPGILCTDDGKIEVATAAFSVKDILTGVRYSSYDIETKTWAPVQSLEVKAHPGEHPSIALTHGNQLHLVWNDYDNAGIMYTSLTLDSPEKQPMGFKPIMVQLETQVPTSTIEAPTITPTPIKYGNIGIEQAPNHNTLLVTSVIPVLAIALSLIAVTLLKRRR